MTLSFDIAFIGGGNMARSLIGGLIARGQAAERIRVAEPVDALRSALADQFGVAATADNAQAAAGADLVVLAVKPQVMREACTGLARTLAARRPLVLSIAAGVNIGQLERWLGAELPIVRAMPNTPAMIGAGVTGLIANDRVGAAHREAAATVLASAGEIVWIPREHLMDAVTAVSGSGPAYFFLLIEALEAAAIAQGLPPEAARRLVVQTALGAARMAREGGEPPALLRERVTSPNGTTAAALGVFDDGGFRALVERAVARATERGRELAAALDG